MYYLINGKAASLEAARRSGKRTHAHGGTLSVMQE
jgi:hypothetical protein